MKRSALSGAVAAFVALQSVPARAQWFDDEGGWSIFSFHRYGGDVNRPGSSPDRPYWHGDDAVPLGLRWRDLEEAKAEAAAQDAAAVSASVAIAVAAPPRHARRHHTVARRRIAPRVAAKDCIPVVVPKP
ncbi:hypothetical protein [Lichenifustis flavocetrariae]|uniref:Uncharacterized protein n=1 Tax=Lichenifustis flavocetrariae TaxID=2949735 RepID=A0AA41Z224_9HYPH|nr:hypothetical protein [Lichenifustis flavocetrariae]MCW6508920.1 hypothetical protein [Lichenifustis flavocetrariae]